MRYLIRYSDGGAGMRHLDEPLWPGDQVTDGGASYKVMRVEQPPSETGSAMRGSSGTCPKVTTSGRESLGLG